jgi:TPP-dependent pyruvate/acetoin dehydrogenase alpha subunit
MNTTERLIESLQRMSLIRAFEERCEELASASKVRGSMHLYTGQEAIAVGACQAMRPEDSLSFTYRSHGWALARGIPPEQVFGEIFGRAGGCAGGWGGSKHLGDWSKHMFPSNAIVGANVPLSVGSALAAQRTGSDVVAVAAFGDGALNQGVMHEAFVIAAAWQLPIVFMCENNQYAEMSPAEEFRAVPSEVARAAGWGIAGRTVDGMDVDAVHSVMSESLEHARSGNGPVFIEAVTYRYCGHMTGDFQQYRTKEEVAEWRLRDPLTNAATALLAAGVDQGRIDSILTDSTAAVIAAEEAAWAMPEPDDHDLALGATDWAGVA